MLTYTQIVEGTGKQMYLSPSPGHPDQGNLSPKYSLKKSAAVSGAHRPLSSLEVEEPS